MKLSIASDHGGVKLRKELVEALKAKGHELIEYGPVADESVDYPDYAQKACADVLEKRSEFAILVCTSGVGMTIAANKIRGIRACFAYNEDSVDFSRRHNDVNTICFGEKYHTLYIALRLLDIFMKGKFEGGRHQRRVDKLACLEAK